MFAALALLALLANVVAGALCHSQARAAPGLVDEVLGVLSICTTDASGNIQHGGAPDPSGRPDSSGCSFCTLLKVVAVAVALAFAAIVFPVRPARAPVVRRAVTLAQHLRNGAIRSRAPPLAA